MKEFSCGDVIPDCGARFRVGSEAEMLAVCAVHAQHHHGLTEPQLPEDLAARVRAAIQTAA
jgi:predicted small metal-binding protein